MGHNLNCIKYNSFQNKISIKEMYNFFHPSMVHLWWYIHKEGNSGISLWRGPTCISRCGRRKKAFACDDHRFPRESHPRGICIHGPP